MASVKLRKSWLLPTGSAHTLFKIPRKFLVIKKLYFSTNNFFPQIVFSGAGVWSQEHINRTSRDHMDSWIPQSSLRASHQIKATTCHRPDSWPDIPFTCLFYLFNKWNKQNLLVSLIFLATTCLYITSLTTRCCLVLYIGYIKFGSGHKLK